MNRLIQLDGDENVINNVPVDVSNYKDVLEKISYYDVRYPANRDLVKNWIESGLYKTEFLSITGESEEEDGFYTESMYLEIETD